MVDLSKPPTRYHGYASVVPRLDRLTQPRVPGAQVVGLRLQGGLQPWKMGEKNAQKVVLDGIWQCVKTLVPL